MANFIIDMNIPTKPGKIGYPDYFFRDMKIGGLHEVVFGGSSYLKELTRKETLQRLLINWMTEKKARRLDRAAVDASEAKIRAKVIEKFSKCPGECDDLHIVAISLVSGCVNIISYDQRMSKCKDKIRNTVGHDYFPNLRFVKTEAVYRATT